MEDLKELLSRLAIDPSSGSFASFLLCVFVGAVLAVLYLVYNNYFVCADIRGLIAKGASGEDLAAEVKKTAYIRLLRSKFVSAFEKDGKYFAYIPENSSGKAASFTKKADISWWKALLAVLAIYAVLLLCYKTVPLFIEDINSYFRWI